MAKLNRVAKKWIARLRSGKVKQSYSTLGTANGKRCCLGVLCDIAVEEKVISEYRLSDVRLPQEVAKWAGLKTPEGDYENQLESSTSLWRQNDGHWTLDTPKVKKTTKKSFKKIADIIESKPKGLFK